MALNAFLEQMINQSLKSTRLKRVPKCVPMKCLDESVALISIKQYLSFDAWKMVKKV